MGRRDSATTSPPSPSAPSGPATTTAAAAAAPAGGWDAIVSLQLAAAEAGDLHAQRADGPRLELQPLPYLLLADV